MSKFYKFTDTSPYPFTEISKVDFIRETKNNDCEHIDFMFMGELCRMYGNPENPNIEFYEMPDHTFEEMLAINYQSICDSIDEAMDQYD